MVKRILITGSNGLLGQKLVALYSQPSYRKKFKVIATSRGENRIQKIQDFEYHSMDICNPEQIEKVIRETQPHALIHTAAMTQVDDCEEQRENCWNLNVNSVKYLSQVCAKEDVFMLHLSTDFIFDGKAGPYREEDEACPISFYGESKLASEKLLEESENLRWAIARTVLVYGISEAMSRSNIILWVKKSLEEGKTIHVVDDQWRSPTLAEDLALGCHLIVAQEASGIFNISGKDFLNPYQMAIETAKYFQLDESLIVRTDGSRFTQVAKRPPRTGFILDKAVQELDYAPRSFKEGIAILDQQLSEMN